MGTQARVAGVGRRVRWWIAGQLGHIPGQCWSRLVDWAIGWRKSPWSPVNATCRSDLAATGSCYCGRLRKDTP